MRVQGPSSGTGQEPSTCVVWWASTSDAVGLDLSLFGEDERARVSRLRFEDDRRRFLVGAALVRILMGVGLGCHPRHVRVRRDCRQCGGYHGPVTVEGADVVSLSVSHASSHVAVAISESGVVGIDIEDGRRPLSERVARSFLHPDERKSTVQEGDLLRVWTRKEAVLKAAGVGLSVTPAEVVVGPGAPASVTRLPPSVCLPQPLNLFDFDLEGAVGALAFAGGPVHVAYERATDLLGRWRVDPRPRSHG